MEYADKVFIYLTEVLQADSEVLISDIARTPQTFIDTVQELIDAQFVTDIYIKDNLYVGRKYNIDSILKEAEENEIRRNRIRQAFSNYDN